MYAPKSTALAPEMAPIFHQSDADGMITAVFILAFFSVFLGLCGRFKWARRNKDALSSLVID